MLAGYTRNICTRRPFSTIIPTNRDSVSWLEARSQEVVASSVTGARPGMDMTRGSELYGFSEVRLLEISLGSVQDTPRKVEHRCLLLHHTVPESRYSLEL